MDEPHCEVCGEQHASVKLLECAVCDDCAADALRESVKDTIGNVCASVSRNHSNGFLQMCLAPHGVEHDH